MVNRYAFADFLAGKKKASVPGIGYRHLCLDCEENTRRCVFFGNLLMFYLAELNYLVKNKIFSDCFQGNPLPSKLNYNNASELIRQDKRFCNVEHRLTGVHAPFLNPAIGLFAIYIPFLH